MQISVWLFWCLIGVFLRGGVGFFGRTPGIFSSPGVGCCGWCLMGAASHCPPFTVLLPHLSHLWWFLWGQIDECIGKAPLLSVCGYVHQSKIPSSNQWISSRFVFGAGLSAFLCFQPCWGGNFGPVLALVEGEHREAVVRFSPMAWIPLVSIPFNSNGFNSSGSGSWLWLLQGQGCRKCLLSVFLNVSRTDYFAAFLEFASVIATTPVCCKGSSFLLSPLSAESWCGCALAHPCRHTGDSAVNLCLSATSSLQKNLSRLFPPLEERLACPFLLHWEVSGWWHFQTPPALRIWSRTLMAFILHLLNSWFHSHMKAVGWES